MKRFYDSTALTEGTFAAHLNSYLPNAREVQMDLTQLKIDTVVFDCTDSRSAPWLIIPAEHGMLKTYSVPGGFIRGPGRSMNDPTEKSLEILSKTGTVKKIILMSHGGCPETTPCAATGELMHERIAKPRQSYYTGLFEQREETQLAQAFRRRNKNFDTAPDRKDMFDLAAISLLASARNIQNWNYAGGRVHDAVSAGALDIIPVYEHFDQISQTVSLHVFNQNPKEPAFVELTQDGSFVQKIREERLGDVTSRAGFIDGACGSSIRSFTSRIRQGGSVITPAH